MRTILIAIEMLSGSIWVGSLVCLALVSSVAREVLDPSSRIVLFRGIGRRYGIVGSAALIVAICAGGVLAGRPSDWSAAFLVVLVLAAVLLVLTALGMVQARRMTVRRRQAVETPGDEVLSRTVRGGAVMAGALRGAIATLTLIILVLGAHVIAG